MGTPGSLHGRAALVTGASRGIGAAIARRLAAEGASVAITARSLDPHPTLPGTLRETAEKIEKGGGRALAIRGDLLDPEDRARVVAEAREHLGPIDLLVNNAAAAFYIPFEKVSEKRYRVAFEINVRAPFDLAQRVVPDMRARGGGAIVNVSSATARQKEGPPFLEELGREVRALDGVRRLASLLACLAILGCGEQATETVAALPNAIVILTDDQPASTLARMPNVERLLVREGTTFENFYLSDPICCPSRATIALGRYRHNHGIGATGACAKKFFQAGLQRSGMGARLTAAGLRTGIVGKYLNNYDKYVIEFGPGEDGDHLLAGWDDYHAIMAPRYHRVYLHEDGEVFEHDPQEHQTDVLADAALTFVSSAVAAGTPFFLYIAPSAPHEVTVPAARHKALLPNAKAPRPPSYDEGDPGDKAWATDRKGLTREEIDGLDSLYRDMLRTLLGVDEMVAALVKLLDAAGQLENTFFFYTSDNGYHFGEHRLVRGKGTPYEESVRFPLVVRGPGVPKNRTLPQLAGNVDLLPTLLEIVGAERDEQLDGRSLLPLLLAGDPGSVPWRQDLVLESESGLRRYGIPGFVALRTDRYKWIEYTDGTRELYDLTSDPYELESLHATAPEDLTRNLSERLAALRGCAGAACRGSDVTN